MSASSPGSRIDLLGIPLELGASEPGAIMGPAALRTAGLTAMLSDLGHVVTDHGDLATPPPVGVAMPAAFAGACRHLPAIAGWIQAIHDRAMTLAASRGVPVFLGGDHSLSMGTVSAMARHCAALGRPFQLLWLDAHADFNTPLTTPSGNMHGMSVAFLSGEPSLGGLLGAERPLVPVAAGHIHLFGLRSIDGGERRMLRERGINAIDMRMIDEFGVLVLVRQILAGMQPGTHLHVSLDVDFLDPGLAPGVGTAVPGGATSRECHLIMEMLHDSGLVGSLDIVELNPFLDDRGKSAKLLAWLTASLFGRTVIDAKPDPAV
jgi:arginase